MAVGLKGRRKGVSREVFQRQMKEDTVERARVKRRHLWAHRASGPRTEATQLLPQGPDLLWCVCLPN